MTAYATNDEILDAFARLSDSELLALRETARQRSGGTRFSEPLDLIHEALYLALEGRRNWPLKIEFTLFLSMTMRSVADAERKRQETRLTVRVSFEEVAEIAPHRMATSRSAEDDASAIEQARLSAEALSSARASLVDDTEAREVFDGLLSGKSPIQMRQALGMSVKAFDAARHRAMRKAKSAATLH